MELLLLLGLGAAVAKMFSSAGSGRKDSETRPATGDPYRFDYRNVDGEWRAYIASQPNYGSRSRDLHSTHRHRDERGHYVCWDSPIESRDDCEAVAREWARHTDRYIRTGERF